MNTQKKLENILEDVREIGYWKLPIPSKTDASIREIIKLYRKANGVERNKAKSDLSDGVAKLLIFFSERMATYALRTGSQEVFDDGLMALEIVYGFVDLAEILVCFSLYYDVSQKHGLSFKTFEGTEVSIREALKGFLSRVEQDKSLEAMGYSILIDDSNQPTYKRNW